MKYIVAILSILAVVGLFVTASKFKKYDVDVINVDNMPGKTAEKLKKNVITQIPKKQGKSIQKLSNGVYIIKDNSVTNQTDIEFRDNFVQDIKLKDIQFADDNFPF